MDLHTEDRQGYAAIVLDKNKLLGTEAAEFQNTVLALIRNGNKSIALDLSNVNYITSWGIGIMIYAHTTCSNKNIDLFLTGVNGNVLDTLKKVKLDKIFKIRQNPPIID